MSEIGLTLDKEMARLTENFVAAIFRRSGIELTSIEIQLACAGHQPGEAIALINRKYWFRRIVYAIGNRLRAKSRKLKP